MTQIILVRHGQTPWNKDKIFRGSRDIPLNDAGREEARLAGEWLKGDTIHAAYCSPLSRARDTGEAIARHHGLPVLDLPGLADICYGDWEGVPLTEVKLKFNSHICKKLQYQIVIRADLTFGTTFSGIGRTAGGMATPAAWSAFPATPGSAVLR